MNLTDAFPPPLLSPCEKNIALGVALGFPQGVLLRGYGLSPVALREHLEQIGTKLGARTGRGAELVFLATRHQQIPLLPTPLQPISPAPLDFLRLLAAGKAGTALAQEMDLPLREADAAGKLLLTELNARTYSHAVYLGAPLLLDARSRHTRPPITPSLAPAPHGR